MIIAAAILSCLAAASAAEYNEAAHAHVIETFGSEDFVSGSDRSLLQTTASNTGTYGTYGTGTDAGAYGGTNGETTNVPDDGDGAADAFDADDAAADAPADAPTDADEDADAPYDDVAADAPDDGGAADAPDDDGAADAPDDDGAAADAPEDADADAPDDADADAPDSADTPEGADADAPDGADADAPDDDSADANAPKDGGAADAPDNDGAAAVAPADAPATGEAPTSDPTTDGEPGPVTPLPSSPPPPPAIVYSKKFSPWSSCTERCGGGEQTREVTCVDPNGEAVDPNLCSSTSEDQLRTKCNATPCPTYAWSSGEWTACSKSCGKGYQTRSVICTRTVIAGVIDIVGGELCTSGARPPDFQFCNQEPCTKPYYTTSNWGSCSETCGGGVQTRTAKCMVPPEPPQLLPTESTDAAACIAASGVDAPALTRPCGNRPCEVFLWQVDDWAQCSAACGGTKTRELSCKKKSGTDALVEAATDKCPAYAPTTTQPCEPCAFCDQPANAGCNGHGTCSGTECTCQAGWGGRNCAVDTTSCASGIRDKSRKCCESGVLAKGGLRKGLCCEQAGDVVPVTDSNGECCPDGFIDACGVCGGTGFATDVTGTCCKKGGVITPGGYCCQSGNVDVAGVCDGAGETVQKDVAMTGVGEAASGRRLLDATERAALKDRIEAVVRNTLGYDTGDDASTGVAVVAVNPSDAEGYAVAITIPPTTTGAAITSPSDIAGALQLAFAEADPAINAASTSVEVSLKCGDGICSPGEPIYKGEDAAGKCAEDCPITLGECDAPPESGVGDATKPCGGNGLCIASTLTCSCFPGYAGDDCSYCGEGYARNGDECELDTSALVDEGESGTPPTSPGGYGGYGGYGGPPPPGMMMTPRAEDLKQKDSNVGTIVGATIGAVGGAAVVTAAAVWWFKFHVPSTAPPVHPTGGPASV